MLDQHRGSARARGYDSRWERMRLQYLIHHPLCVHCQAEGRVAPAVVLDHIVPHRGDSVLFFDSANLQGLCVEHDDRKRLRENGLRACPHGHACIVQGRNVCVLCGTAQCEANPTDRTIQNSGDLRRGTDRKSVV